ncbi:hypothetical protein Tco_0455626 [Tanacetum coccineum]
MQYELGEANSVYTSYIVSSASNGKIQAGALIFVLVGYIEEHLRCCQAKVLKVKEKLVHLMMVVKFKVLIEKKKICSLGLMRFDLWMEILMVHLEELEIKKLL